MTLIEKIIARAQANPQRIVLPEAEEERTLIAADKALADKLANIILIGNPAKVQALAEKHGLTILWLVSNQQHSSADAGDAR